jgi:magnesium transporter
MIQSFVFNDGKLVASNLDSDALRLVRADKGLLIWVNLSSPTPEESRVILEDVFSFHPLAIEDCLSESRYPKIEDYEDYLFLVMHAVAFSKQDQFRTTELDFFIGKTFLVTHHTEPLAPVASTIWRTMSSPPATASRPSSANSASASGSSPTCSRSSARSARCSIASPGASSRSSARCCCPTSATCSAT